jgi:hypothetical protein
MLLINNLIKKSKFGKKKRKNIYQTSLYWGRESGANDFLFITLMGIFLLGFFFSRKKKVNDSTHGPHIRSISSMQEKPINPRHQ